MNFPTPQNPNLVPKEQNFFASFQSSFQGQTKTT